MLMICCSFEKQESQRCFTLMGYLEKFCLWSGQAINKGKSMFLYLKGSIANLFSRLVSIMTYFKDENKNIKNVK